jgi:hypothetical protein
MIYIILRVALETSSINYEMTSFNKKQYHAYYIDVE